MSEIDIERLKVDADYWDRQWDRLDRWQKLKAVTVLGVPRPNENYMGNNMGYAIYIGTISALAYSLLNSALSAIGV